MANISEILAISHPFDYKVLESAFVALRRNPKPNKPSRVAMPTEPPEPPDVVVSSTVSI